MGNIVLLDDLTINKIAAGEVIERPASVVKEMVENSIDAGAKNITIEIEKGGISLIRITDDGCGISEDDMEIAFERHATSKIRSADDLAFIKSMGFRGEALASIASIARVEMVSKKQGTDVAHKLVVEGGKTIEFTDAARSVGTTITVKNLFYNTPVRYKFLKKDYTEAGYIEDVVTRIALVNKDVSIKLISKGKTIVHTNGNGDFNTVIYSIYGKDVAAETIPVDYEYEGIKITGVIGKPVIARANRTNQLFFLNGRFIKDKNLSAAADQAYKGMIPIGRYGFIVLNLEMDPKLVDVNVHPAKLEVRFEEEGKVFKAVYHAIKSNMAQSELVANVQKSNLENKQEVKEEIKAEGFENYTEKAMEIFKHEEEDRKASTGGFSGLFHKLIKEPDETAEELSNNHLEEIFKFRQGVTENKPIDGVGVNNISKDNENYSDDKFINSNEVNKTASFGDTLISSDTHELNVNDVNDAIKDKINELANKVQSNNNGSLEALVNDLDKTQSVNINDTKVSQETQVINGGLNQLPQNTVKFDTSDVRNELNNNSVDDGNNEEANSNPNAENAMNDMKNEEGKNEDFSSFAEKLVEAKLSLENTQMIDTTKVREALKEDFQSNPEFDKMYKKTFGVDPFSVRKERELEEQEKEKMNVTKDFTYATGEENASVFTEGEEQVPEVPYKFLGIAFNTYIIIEIKNEMYILDQHAAHERIMYEKAKANYYSNDGANDEQLLLIPDVITLTHKEMSVARENIDMFKRAGFTFDEFGENTIKLVSVPSMCENLNTKQLFLDILDEVDTVAVTARQEKEDKFIATVACKAAVKAKMKLDVKEVDALMSKLLQLPNPFTCPHGRPTAIKMTKYDLDRKFDRR